MRRHWIPVLLATSLLASSHPRAPSAQPTRGASTVTTPDFSEARQLIRDWMAKDSLPGLVPATRGQRYGLGWWVEQDRLGYRSVLAQGGTDAAQAWLRVVPSERIAVVVLANKGVGFPADLVDAVLAALLPRYAELLAAQRAQAAQGGAGQPAAAAAPLDSALVGTWDGFVRAENGKLALEFAVTDSGAVRATIGSRSGARSGRARFAGTLFPLFRLALPGDLETPDSMSGRGLAFYLQRRTGVLTGTVTTRPPVVSDLDGRVSYWVELTKRPQSVTPLDTEVVRRELRQRYDENQRAVPATSREPRLVDGRPG